jgi:hypothetical protein
MRRGFAAGRVYTIITTTLIEFYCGESISLATKKVHQPVEGAFTFSQA